MYSTNISRVAMLLAFGLTVTACGPDKPANTEGTPPEPSATATQTAAPPPSATAAAPSSPDTAKGMKALQSGDLAGAKAAFEAALQSNPKDADATFYLGVTLDKGGDKAGAEKNYAAALQLRPDFPEAAQNLAAIDIEAKKWDAAIMLLRPLAQKRANDPAVHENLALALAGKGDQAGATKEFEAAQHASPNDAMLLYTYGHQLAVWRDPGAVAKLTAARDAATDADLLASIGHDLLLLRAVPQCIATFDKAIKVKDSAPSRTERGLCKMASKDEAGAAADLQAAIKADPSYALAHYWLGAHYGQSKKWKDAIKEFEAYLKIAPDGPKARAAKAAIARAKKKGKK